MPVTKHNIGTQNIPPGTIEASDLADAALEPNLHLRPMRRGWKLPSAAKIPWSLTDIDLSTYWTPARGTVAYDTDNVLRCTATGTIRACKLAKDGTNTNNAAFVHDYGGGDLQDLSGGALFVEFFVWGDADDDCLDLGLVQVALVDGDAKTATYVFWYRGTKVIGASNATEHEGWNRACSLPTNPSSGDGTIDMTRIQTITLSLFNVAGHNTSKGAITLANLCVLAQPTVGSFIFWFEYANSRLYDVACYLAEHGMRGCFALNQYVIGASGRLTLAQCQNIVRMGHTISIYGADALAGPVWGLHTLAHKKEIIAATRAWFIDNGLGESGMLAGRGGGFNTDDEWLLDNGWINVMVQQNADVSYVARGIGDPRLLYFCMTDTVGTSGSSAANFTTQITAAVADKGYMLCFGHCDTDAKRDRWEAIVDEVVALRDAGTIQVVAAQDLLYGDVV